MNLSSLLAKFQFTGGELEFVILFEALGAVMINLRLKLTQSLNVCREHLGLGQTSVRRRT